MAAHWTPCRALQPLVADLGAEGKEAKSFQVGFTNLYASCLTPKSVRYLQKSQSLLLNCAPFAFLFILTGTDSASLLQSQFFMSMMHRTGKHPEKERYTWVCWGSDTQLQHWGPHQNEGSSRCSGTGTHVWGDRAVSIFQGPATHSS